MPPAEDGQNNRGETPADGRRRPHNSASAKVVRAARKLRHLVSAFARGSLRWDAAEAEGLRTRQYRSYDDYLEHQKSKLDVLQGSTWLENYDQLYHETLVKRLKGDRMVKPGAVVLCLAARIGTEVKAFLDHGCFAVGLDLNPGMENRYVVYGDFHQIQFPDATVDVVFTNSLDHALELPRVVAEIARVLKPGGCFILEAAKGEDEAGTQARFWEATSWRTMDDLLGHFTSAGFEIERRRDFNYPWKGEHVTFRLSLPVRPPEQAR